MRILVTKGRGGDRIEAQRVDGTVARSDVTHKGPIAHDLVHFVVETEFGFNRGFWGLVAAGHDPDAIADMAKAAGHASAKRAEQPDTDFVAAIQAERIVECFEAESWSRGSDNGSLRAMAEAGCDQSLVETPRLSDERIDRARVRLAELAAQWAALPVGDSLSLDWPEPDQAAA